MKESKSMTKEEFKRRWESDHQGDGITIDDVRNCAINWELCAKPMTRSIQEIRYLVLIGANVVDAEDFKPNEDEE